MIIGKASILRTSSGAPSTMVTAALYFASALSLLTLGDRGGMAVFCCVDAILLSALLLRPRRDWWRPVLACMAAALLANLFTQRGLATSAAFAIGNMVAPLAGAAVMRGVAGDKAAKIDSSSSVILFVLAAGALAPAIGASIGAVTLHLAFGSKLAPAWIEWFAADAAGILLGTPLLLMLWRGELWRFFVGNTWRRLGVSALLGAAVAAGSLIAFSHDFAPLLFLPAILVIVAGFFAGRVGAAISVLVVALIGSETVAYAGGQLGLVSGDPHLQVLFLQSYLAVVLLTALPVAASLEEGQRLQSALVESEARYRAMADNSGDLITWVDRNGICRYASSATRDILGMPPETLVGMEVGDLIHAEDIGMVVDHHRRMLASRGEVMTILYRARHADGHWLWMEARSRAMLDEQARLLGIQWTIRDVTAHKTAEATLSEAANSDPLTGLANRRAFFSLLDIAITRARVNAAPLALAVVDVDHFKQVNDTWGHEAGDTALSMMARACQKAVRGDDLLARLGGEEFALMMPGTDLEAATKVCERLRAAVAALSIPITDGDDIAITLSAGLTLLHDEDDAAALVRAGDRALYAAKHDGRDRIQIAARDAEKVRRRRG